MKKLFVIILAMMAIGYISCKKDYREKWVGNWDFEINYTVWVNPPSGGPSYCCFDTLYSYSGKISLGVDINQLNINYMEDDLVLVVVDEYGKISGEYHNRTEGQFEGKNKVYISDNYYTKASHSIYTINGEKKKGGKK